MKKKLSPDIEAASVRIAKSGAKKARELIASLDLTPEEAIVAEVLCAKIAEHGAVEFERLAYLIGVQLRPRTVTSAVAGALAMLEAVDTLAKEHVKGLTAGDAK